MTALEVTFSDEWLTMPMAHSRGVTTLLPTAAQLRFDHRASLALLDEYGGSPVRAFCAVGTVPGRGDGAVRAAAENGPHPGLERDTATVRFDLGPALRSAAFRFDPALLDDDTVLPFTAEVRFALPLPADRIGVLHFETLSLACFERLESLFDTIAGTARIA